MEWCVLQPGDAALFFLRVCAPTRPPGCFSQCGLCGASAQDLDLRSLLRSPNQRRIWRQLVRVVIACLSISPVRRRGRGLRSVHGELRRAHRASVTCWPTETGLLLPTGMLPVPYGPASPHPGGPPHLPPALSDSTWGVRLLQQQKQRRARGNRVYRPGHGALSEGELGPRLQQRRQGSGVVSIALQRLA